jgi:hypothetical protein
VKQVVLAYLGKYDNVKDAWMNATEASAEAGAVSQTPEDRANDAAMEAIAKEYQRKMRELSKREVEAMLPHLYHPKKDRLQWTPCGP